MVEDYENMASLDVRKSNKDKSERDKSTDLNTKIDDTLGNPFANQKEYGEIVAEDRELLQ